MTTRTSTPPRWLTLLALAAYTAVVLALTMFKAFYQIGYLWNPDNQRQQGISLQLFGEFSRGDSWFAPLFGYVGNIAFFVPFGMLLYFLLRGHASSQGHASSRGVARTIVLTTLIGMCTSAAIEAAQYIFSLGFTDIDDLIMNTFGAALGGVIAAASDKIFGPRGRWAWVSLALALGIVFAVLVGLGERLGDPDKVVEVN
ncbi:VanZ family protein [Corynebacterium sp. 320]|uniref:VanZ family protein n=1 Tax=Corynebacterium TaxID=1716 RepID=UPI00125CAC28|nr:MULTISPECIES: VanZ family protein [Corynebacterium]KAB1503893.1 VanZ family protein [Corynebacterium sp. 320]KAB1553008.1 VanZ family protein [Corynebacterium sp. 321]KAB1553772.1 VanZ family protein [Corynebacterium sp. 319]KAB3528029.1 VanZ family protein [Corynebacterium sp. 250]KAB3540482.1 VanZ family protein [Corynebacterium sp. 366]